MHDTGLRWGILGAARFAREHMAPAIAAAPGARLVALASRSGQSGAGPFRSLAPDLVVHESYSALLRDPDVDAVYIPLPNNLHHEWTLRATEAGKHVLCEKPMAMHAAQIDELSDARARSGRLVAEAFMIAHHPQWRVVCEWLHSGSIGELRHMQATFGFNNEDRPGDIRNNAELGGGALRDLGVYVLGATQLIGAGQPDWVEVRMRLESGVDTLSLVRAGFEGLTLDASVSMRLAPFQQVTFLGSRGWIRMNAPFNAEVYGDTSLELRRPDGSLEVRRFNQARQYGLQLEAFHRSVHESRAFPWPLERSRAVQAIIDKALDSAVPLD